MNVVKLLTQAEAKTLIDKIGSVAVTLQADIHQAACSVFNHAFVHGDNTGITRLLDKCTNGLRVKALAHWFNHFSNGAITLSQEKDTKSWKVNPDRFARRADLMPNLAGSLAKAMDLSFADLVPEKGHETLTLKQFLKSLKRSATNAENFDGTSIPKVSLAVRTVASELVKIVEAAMKAKDDAQPAIDVLASIKTGQPAVIAAAKAA